MPEAQLAGVCGRVPGEVSLWPEAQAFGAEFGAAGTALADEGEEVEF
jgi:hypothetical protein